MCKSLRQDDADLFIIDCLTLFVSELLMQRKKENQIIDEIKRLAQELKEISGLGKKIIVVTNEVGCGIVPKSPLGRRFRDLAGIANQIIAGISDEMYTMVAGVAHKLK